MATTTVHIQATGFVDDLTLMIVDLGRSQVVLGMPWLAKYNPHIDWEKKTVTFTDEHICKTTLSTELAIAAHKEEVTLPSQYSAYIDVFSEQTFDILSPQRDFDHAIELKESFTPRVAKLYPLNPEELTACQAFVDENLKTGWI